MTRNFVIGAVLLLAVLAGAYVMAKQSTSGCRIDIGTTALTAETAKTSAEWEKGLMYRTSMPANHGMLFLFPKLDYYSFWMKNTLIPLDIIWINQHSVVEIASLPAVIPGDTQISIPQHAPSYQADAVLEINQGLAKSLGIHEGSHIVWHGC